MHRVLYVGDVPIQESHHGSALLYRLFEEHSPGCLQVVETGEPSQGALRLSGVEYLSMPIGRRRWLNTRLHNLYSSWLHLVVSDTREGWVLMTARRRGDTLPGA